MELRSGRRLVYPPLEQREGGRRRRSQQSSEDRITYLPEDLLLEILIRLRSAAGAAHVGAVCRSWRGLWTELPELRFWDTNPQPVMSALTRITRPSLNLLEINLMMRWGEEWVDQISLFLRAAALVLPKKLIIFILARPTQDFVVELPCFERTSYLSLNLNLGPNLIDNIPIMLPQSGEFTALESLHLESCYIDLKALLSLCPCLRILNIRNINNFRHVDTVMVQSPLLEELGLEINNHDICRIDIATPTLKEVTLEVVAKSLSLSFSAPMVKKLRWSYYDLHVSVGFGHVWHLMSIEERDLDELYVVSLTIKSYANVHVPNDLLDAEWSITQVIANLPVTAFSVLELDLNTNRHTFGPMMLCLLQIQPTLQRLKMVIVRDKLRVPCPVNCPCEHPINWRSEDISLTNLEVVELHGLQGEDDEADFLKIIFRCATVLRRLTMTVSDDISPSNHGYEKICNIMKEHPDVECHIMASGSEEVLYP